MKKIFTKVILSLLLFSFTLNGQEHLISNNFIEQGDTYSEKEARLLLIRSLIFPGWGEHALGKNKRGAILNGVEIAGWVTYYFWRSSSLAYRKDMKAFAVAHAGINPAGKNSYYYIDIGNYDNIFDYNDAKLRARQVDLLYPVNSEYYWAWDSPQNRKKFEKIRIRSAAHNQYATFTLVGLALNRVVSVFDIILLTKGKIEKSDVEIESSFYPNNSGWSFTLGFKF